MNRSCLKPIRPLRWSLRRVHAIASVFLFFSPVLAAQQNEVAKLVANDGAWLDVLGTSVAISGNTAILGASGDDDGGDSSGAAYVFVQSGGASWLQQQKLTASDAGALDQFGWDVSVAGDTAVVGARLGRRSGLRTGAAYVFVRTGSTWSEQQKLTASDAASGDQFGSTVAISGDTVVVGAWNDRFGSSSTVGSAYVFARSGSTWTQQQKLVASDAAAFDEFGTSVSVDGDTIVIGAKGDDDNGVDSGSMYVFVRSGSVWTEQQKLTASDGAAGDFFGWSVSVSADTAIVGAYRDDDAASNSGSAYVFVRTGSTWTQQQKLTANDASFDARFGYSVAVSGDVAVVGASYADDQGSDSGTAYAFTRSRAVWTQQKLRPSDGAATETFAWDVAVCGATALVGSPGSAGVGAGYLFHISSPRFTRLLADDGRANDLFGASVAMSGNIAAIGAPYDDDRGTDSGAVYVFERGSNGWGQRQKLVPGDGTAGDAFGWSVAVSGSILVVGAPLDDDRGAESGSAYVYLRDSLGVWNLLQKLTASDGQAADRFGYGIAVDGGSFLPFTTIVVGALRGDGITGDSGSAYVFAASGFTFVQQQELVATDGAANDSFGVGVSLSAGTAVIGAPDDDDGGASSGSAYVFVQSGGVWSQQQKLTASDRAAGDAFGLRVSASGDTIAIGAYLDDDAGSASGSAYVFVRSGFSWSQQQKLTAGDRAAGDQFGSGIAVAGEHLVVGAIGEDYGAESSGSAYVFSRSGGAWTQQWKLNASRDAGDFFGYAVAISGDEAIVGAPAGDGCGSDTGEAFTFALQCVAIPYGTGCGGAVLSSRPDPTTPGIHELILTDPGTIAIAIFAFGDQRLSLPFPPNCTVLNNLLFGYPAMVQGAHRATLRVLPSLNPGYTFQVQGVVGLTNGWLDLSNGIEFVCP